MALTVDYCYRYVLGLIRKNQSGGLIPTDFQNFFNDGQSSMFDDLTGRFQPRSNTKEGANTGLIQDETIIAKLTPFTLPVTLNVVGGQATKPTDWAFTLALRCNGFKVYQVDKDEIQDINNSTIDPPSDAANKYYFTEYQNYYKVFPSDITSIDVDYIQTPPDVVWGFTVDGNGRYVYNPATSVDPKWSNNSCREICKRILKLCGVSYSSQDFENFGQSIQTQGE